MSDYMNPWLAAGLGAGGNILSGLGGALFGSPERDLARTQNEMLRQKMEWMRQLYPMLMRMYQGGHSINPMMQERAVGQFQQAMAPEWNRVLSNMGRTGDVRSPVLARNLASVLFPQVAGYRRNLTEMDMAGMAQLRALLAQMAG